MERRNAAGVARRGRSFRPGRPTAARPAGTRSAAGRSTTTRSSARRFPARRMRSAASPRTRSGPRRASSPIGSGSRSHADGARAAGRAPARRDRLERRDRPLATTSAPGRCGGHRAGGAAVRAEHPRRRVPASTAGGGAAWCSPASTAMVIALLGHGPSAADLAWVDPALADPCGRPRGALHLRRGLRRHGQLAVQHRLRGALRARRVRHAPALAGRGRAVRRRRHPARRLDRCRAGRARRLPAAAGHGRPSGRRSSASRTRATRSSTTRRRRRTTRCAAATTGRSSSASGSRAPGERST